MRAMPYRDIERNVTASPSSFLEYAYTLYYSLVHGIYPAEEIGDLFRIAVRCERNRITYEAEI